MALKVWSLKFGAQGMHQIRVIKYCIILKLVYKNKNELPGTSMTFQDERFQV